MRRIGLCGLIAVLLLLSAQAAVSQGVAEVVPDMQVYNFGTIEENDGLASHVFWIRNGGTAPLVITRVTASCGCTKPEWSKEPVAPGDSTMLRVTYNPKGRPGPFYKTISIYSNASKQRYNLAVKGNVKSMPKEPVYNYMYAVGSVKLHTGDIIFSEIRENETLGRKVGVKNFGMNSVEVRVGKLPDWLIASMKPDTLMPDKTGELTFLLDASKLKKKGRIVEYVPLETRLAGRTEAHSVLRITANCVDDFSHLTTEQLKHAPKAVLSGTLLNFGTLKDNERKVSGTVELTNSGDTDLHIYSVTSDDSRVSISGGKKTVKPGQTVTFKIMLKATGMENSFATLVTFVTNAPESPVSMLKVTARKQEK